MNYWDLTAGLGGGLSPKKGSLRGGAPHKFAGGGSLIPGKILPPFLSIYPYIHIPIHPYIQISRYPDIQISNLFTYVLLSGIRLELNRTPSHGYDLRKSTSCAAARITLIIMFDFRKWAPMRAVGCT